jgi:mannosyltransferase OCH1-like enzyme
MDNRIINFEIGVFIMIPKIIHYIWLGGKPKPPLVNICILSWREKLPDYKIIEWNESNLNLDKIALENRFFNECRKRNMWAFMADYLRLKILYEYGGIYMDTDMQVVKNLTPLLEETAFIGQENENGIINGAIVGCSKNNLFIFEVMNYYDEKIWNEPTWIIPRILTDVLKNSKVSASIHIYPAKFFYPYPYSSEFKPEYIEDAYTIHWWAGSWIGKFRTYLFLRTKHIHNPIKKNLARIKKTVDYIRLNL